jgi:outer membrane immunogenic protein
MKKVLLVTASLIALGATAPASAADLAARPYTKAPPMVATVYDWTGFYIGINGGWGSSHDNWTNVGVGGVPFAPAGEGSHDASGGTVGGQVGYRWQSGGWVFGVEAQGNWADFTGSNFSTLTALTDRTKVDAYGLFTGQVGYAWTNTLFYVKGGAAVTDNRYQGLFAGALVDSASDTRWGGTVGAGLEYAFAPGWSAAVEYDHLFMGTNTYNLVTPGGVLNRTDTISQDIDLVTVRLNY